MHPLFIFHLKGKSESSSVVVPQQAGSQAEGREFDPHFPLDSKRSIGFRLTNFFDCFEVEYQAKSCTFVG
jgi:hypothetical protein